MTTDPPSLMKTGGSTRRSDPAKVEALAHRLAVVVLNYRTPDLVLDCLASLENEIDAKCDIVIVVDNGSGDDSADQIKEAIRNREWEAWARVVRSKINQGFAGGNNVGVASTKAGAYLLLNSDTNVRPGALELMLTSLEENADVGIVCPTLQWPDGEPQVSCFRVRTPISELLDIAATGPLTNLLRRFDVPMGDTATCSSEPGWVSFACAMIRAKVIDDIGPLDDGYFMYCEDIDFCRRARRAGWTIKRRPEAHVVHLRGGTSSVKSDTIARRRRPRYYYESRSRYFASHYSVPGLWAANILWTLGWLVALTRRMAQGKATHAVAHEPIDIWTNALRPLKPHRQETVTK